jgi:nucleoside-diphosphate-sugar epimerase
MNSEERVLVTGANGLLGTNTIIELLNQGYHVTGFLRDKKSFVGSSHHNLEFVEGNILNKDDLNRALINCKYIIHIAATTDPKLSKYSDFEKINVSGTINVVETAIEKNLKRIIYVSTANTFGYGSLDSLGDESKQMMSPFIKSNYSKSKKEAQDYVLTKKNEIETVIVNPSFMIGAYDSKPSSGKIILIGIKKHILLCPPGGKNFVCVKDVSKGIIAALNQGSAGEAYLLSNANMSYRLFFKLLRNHTKSKTIILQLPKLVLLIVGWIGNCMRFVGFKTQFSLDNMKILCVKNYYSNTKAKEQLGISFSPIESGLLETIDWFKNNNKL